MHNFSVPELQGCKQCYNDSQFFHYDIYKTTRFFHILEQINSHSFHNNRLLARFLAAVASLDAKVRVKVSFFHFQKVVNVQNFTTYIKRRKSRNRPKLINYCWMRPKLVIIDLSRIFETSLVIMRIWYFMYIFQIWRSKIINNKAKIILCIQFYIEHLSPFHA